MNRAGRFISAILVAGALSLGGAVGAAPITVTTPAPAAAPVVKMDINTASADQLATLPGIGAVRSAAIVKGRPYKRKDELVLRKIIPQGVYSKIKDQIIATQP